MARIYFILFLILNGLNPWLSQAQSSDTTSDSTQKEAPAIDMELGIYTRYVWRGVSFGNDAPSVQVLLLKPLGNFEIGTYAATTWTGTKAGYGNTLEIFASYHLGNFTFTIDDYFFFEALDADNDYFNYGKNTPHFIEARVGYEVGKFNFLGGYAFHSRAEDETNGVYLEATCQITEHVSIVAGGVTAPSFLNFMDKAGITNIGLYVERPIQITPTFGTTAKAAIIVNPNHQYNAPVEGVGRSPVLLVASLIF